MIRQSDILTAINCLITDNYPNYMIYTQLSPENLERPSFLLELVRLSQKDVNRMTVEKTAHFKITYFTKMDEFQQPDAEDMLYLQDDILQLFVKGYIRVKDRAIKLISSIGSMDKDRAYIELQFEYVDNRTDEEDNTPLITSVTTKF